jgi:ribosomal protein S18 acetylase RimI-like enzyme/O-antigen ligase
MFSLNPIPRQRVSLDRPVLVQMTICLGPALILVSLAQRTLAASWLYGAVLIMFGYSLFRKEHVRFATLIVGLIPVLMLLRTDFFYNLLIVLLIVASAYWIFSAPKDGYALWANLVLRFLVLASIGYWITSYWLTGDYSSNFRVLELVGTVCLIFLLGGSHRHLTTAMAGITFSALSICLALLPYGERLGMADLGGNRLGNPITLGVALALAVTLSIADRGRWLSFGGGWYRIALGVISAAFLLLTTSRGAWAVAIGNILMLMFLGRRQRFATVGLLLVLGLSVPIIMASQRGEYLEMGVLRTLPIDRSWTQISSGRSDQWLLFPLVFNDSPFWGYGPGLGQTEYATYSLRDPRVEYRPGEKADWHSLYLQLGVEGGLIGLLTLALLIVPLLFSGLQHLRATGEIVPLLGVVGFLIVAASVSGMDAISGVFLGLGFMSTRFSAHRLRQFVKLEPQVRTLPLTRKRARRFLPRLMSIDATTMGQTWGSANWLWELPEKWELSWMMFREQEPVGFIVASRKESALHIHRFAIAQHDRDRGLGTQLLGVAVRHGVTRGCQTITLKVDSQNEAALRFYQRLGFKVLGSSGENLAMVADADEIISCAG